MLDELTKELEKQNSILETTKTKIDEIKGKIIEELKNIDSKNYKNDKALYSLVTKSNDKFNEAKFKEENKEIYDKYLKTKISFDITTFKKKEKELAEKYTEKGEISYSLRIKENEVEEEK